MTTKPDPMKLEELPEIAMHAPIEMSMAVHCVTGDGKKARMTMTFPPGRVPAIDTIEDILEACVTQSRDEPPLPPGIRLMNKPEFVAHITERESGLAMPMPGNQEFEPIQDEFKIPKSMLIHAILGCDGLAYEDGDKWKARGLCEDIDGSAVWIDDQLEKLDEAQLLEIYHEITAG